jgi:hypothetical protein
MPKLENIELGNCPFITSKSVINIARCEYFSPNFTLEQYFEQCNHIIDDQVLWEMSFSNYFYNTRKINLNDNYNIETGINQVFEHLKRNLPI